MRTALAEGMHTDMPVADLGEAHVQRCRKIWWTVYVLDRKMTALMGLPQSIHDEDITCPLPGFSSLNKQAAALNMQIKLGRIYAEIARSTFLEYLDFFFPRFCLLTCSSQYQLSTVRKEGFGRSL